MIHNVEDVAFNNKMVISIMHSITPKTTFLEAPVAFKKICILDDAF